MSDPRAIAAVTCSLRKTLEARMNEDFSDFNAVKVLARAPELILTEYAELADHKLTLFLYQLARNAAISNADLPTRRRDGGNGRQPVLALDLHYLLTAYGLNHDEEDAQHLLAHAMSVIHDSGVIGREQIGAALTGTAWASSGLADQIEQVTLSPAQLDDEALFRMWTTFGGSYRISYGYVATAVLVERPRTSGSAPPVRRTGLVAAPLDRPVIEVIEPRPVTAAATVTVRGRNLASDEVVVRLATGDVTVDPDKVGPFSLELSLPDDLAAGPNGIQVLHKRELPESGETRLFATSRGYTFMLAPKLKAPVPTAVEQGADLTLKITPKVGRRQRVLCLLGARALVRKAPAGSAELTGTVKFAIPDDFPAGDHSLRVSADGAESELTDDGAGSFTEPKLEVTTP
jgi:hypothetical protein